MWHKVMGRLVLSVHESVRLVFVLSLTILRSINFIKYTVINTTNGMKLVYFELYLKMYLLI
jgi:hypothetical protein